MGFVIVLSVFLIAAVATLASAIDLTVRTIYRYTEFFTYTIPQRTTLSVPDDQIRILRADPRIDRVVEGAIFFTNIRTVMGRLPFVVLGVSSEDRNYLMQRMGTTLVLGRLPAEGMPEAVLSEPMVENKRLKLGDIVSGPTDEGGIAGSPIPVRLVGVLRGPVWVAFTDKSFCETTFLATPRCQLYTSRDPRGLDAINRDMMPVHDKTAGRLSPTKVQLLSRDNLIAEVRDSLATMYLIMEIVSAIVVFVIALLSGMLANIYFTQRVPEFGVLAALGYSRSRLVGRIVVETAVLTLMSWAVGALVSMGALTYLKEAVFRSRGLFLDPMDPWAFAHTLPIPVAITLFSVATIAYRLLRLDPVTIIERR